MGLRINLFSMFMELVRFARLLLRRSVRRSETDHVPLCITHLLKDLNVDFEDVVWHELRGFKTVDGLIQGYNMQNRRVFIAWADMGEIFRSVHFGVGNLIRRYHVTVTPYIWEPLLTEKNRVKEIEKNLELDTRIDGSVSRTFNVRRAIKANGDLVEIRENRVRREVDSDDVQCNTEKRLYVWSSTQFILHKKKWWLGDESKLPRDEQEVWYDYNGKQYKKFERQVNGLGDAVEKSFTGDSSKPNITIVQKYNETSNPRRGSMIRCRHRGRKSQAQITDLGDSISYAMPDSNE